MKKKQDEFVGIKLNKVDLINIDSHAESKGMNRSEFIKQCIFSELDRTANDAALKAKQNDAERIIQAIVENNQLYQDLNDKLMQAGRGIVDIQKAFILLFPNESDKLYKLFGEKKHA